MASGQDAGFLEKSSTESSTESTTNIGNPAVPTVIAGPSVRTLSSPAILELSMDEARYQDADPVSSLRRNRSCPQHVSEETPLNSNAESSEHEESDPSEHEEQGNEDWSAYCMQIKDCLLNNLVEFRKSKFICLFQALVSLLPFSAIAMGITYADGCHEYKYLPIFGALTGVLGVLLVALWMAMAVCQQRRMPCFDQHKFVIGFTFLTVTFLVIIDMAFVFHMSPSFDESDKNYCNEAFYRFAVRKEYFTLLAYALAAMIYLPRSRHTFCCCCCIRAPLQPPNVIYHAI